MKSDPKPRLIITRIDSPRAPSHAEKEIKTKEKKEKQYPIQKKRLR